MYYCPFLPLSLRWNFLYSCEFIIFIAHIVWTKLCLNHQMMRGKRRFNFMVELGLTFPFNLHYIKG